MFADAVPPRWRDFWSSVTVRTVIYGIMPPFLDLTAISDRQREDFPAFEGLMDMRDRQGFH